MSSLKHLQCPKNEGKTPEADSSGERQLTFGGLAPLSKIFTLFITLCMWKAFICPLLYPPLVKNYLLGNYSLASTRETKTNKALFATPKRSTVSPALLSSPLPWSPSASWDFHYTRGLVAITYTTHAGHCGLFQVDFSICLHHQRLCAFLKP